MKFKSNEELKKMCDEHWSYIRKLVVMHDEHLDPKIVDKIGYHYTTAMYHGYKHAVEDMGKQVDKNNL